MNCPACNSNKITTLKIHIIKPEGAKKLKCLECGKSWIQKQKVTD